MWWLELQINLACLKIYSKPCSKSRKRALGVPKARSGQLDQNSTRAMTVKRRSLRKAERVTRVPLKSMT